VKNGASFSNKKVVCIVTGSGLKDPDTALKSAHELPETPADLETVEKIILQS
jgi:threonine synthase